MPTIAKFTPLDLFKVAKFIARISGGKEINEPPFLVALDFFKPLEDGEKHPIPDALHNATAVIVKAHDSLPSIPFSAAMRQMRSDMEKGDMSLELKEPQTAIDDTPSRVMFIRLLTANLAKVSQNDWEKALDATIKSWKNKPSFVADDEPWAKDFAKALFEYLRTNPYKLYSAEENTATSEPAQLPEADPQHAPEAEPKPESAPVAHNMALRDPYTKVLHEQVLGQPLALRKFDESQLLNAWMPEHNGLPKLFLLAGPHATGKSTFARTLAQEWELRGGEHITIDMASMLSHNEGFGLTGLRSGYDSAAPGRLTSFVREHPEALVILENVTRAHPNVQSLLTPLLTSGKLIDEYGFGSGADRGRPQTRDVSFANATVLLTCTVGEAIFERPSNLKLYEENPDALVAMLKDAMANIGSEDTSSRSQLPHDSGRTSPLLPYLQQINMLPFRPLDLAALEQIALAGMDDVAKVLAAKNVQISWGSSTDAGRQREDRQQIARLFALGSAPQFSPLMVRKMAADKILRQWLYSHPNLAEVHSLTVTVESKSLGLLGLDTSADALQRDYFRRSQRLAFSVSSTDVQTLQIHGIGIERIATQQDYGTEGGISVELPQLRFADIFGHDVIKDRLAEVVRLLKDSDPGNQISLPRGMLLHGQPGTGKTMLAKALASEAGLPFIAASGPQLLDIDNIRTIFRRARQYAPCLVFLDEIDALGVRGSGGIDPCINQLLVEIDGFKSADEGHVFVIAATNFRNKVDPALTRSGRLDLCLEVPLLDKEARRHFLEKLQAQIKLKPGNTFPMEDLLVLSAGMAGADLEKLVREVQLTAIRRGQSEVAAADLLEELNVIKHGARLDNPPLREQLAITAHHEAGHAVVSRALNPDVRIEQVTIVPRRNALGFTAYAEDSLAQRNFDREEVMDLICVALAGRVAQRKYMAQLQGPAALDKGSDAGADSDLQHATRLAWRAITRWGLDDAFGWVSTAPLGDDEHIPRHLEDIATERTKAWIDEARTQTEKVVNTNWQVICDLANGLLADEILLGNKLENLLKGAQA